MSEIQEILQNGIKILRSAEFGRYLVADRDVEPLSLILREAPIIYGPGDDDQEVHLGEFPMCLGCCVRLVKGQRCDLCGWPICGNRCQQMKIHAQYECDLFRKGNVTYPPPHTWLVINKSVLVLRCLLLKQTGQTDTWGKNVDALEHHTQIRYKKSYCIKGDEMLLENLKYFLGPLKDDLRREIVKISGIINVNAFSTTSNSNNRNNVMIAQCIYGTASLFANSCIPNCTWRVEPPPSLQICVRSAVPITKGEMITISYSPHDTLCGTLQRQVSNEDVAHFICTCSRCKDPTEFGTFISAVKCCNCGNGNKGDEGFLLPLDPLVPESPWICNSKSCDESQSVHKIVAQTYPIQQMFEATKRSGLERCDEIKELKNILEVGKNIFHPNHYTLQDIRMHIVKRQIPVVSYLSGTELTYVIHQTKVLLNMANILAPGFSQIRALLQHFLAQELQALQKKDATQPDADKSQCNSMVQCLERNALLFFQHHNFHSENDTIIKIIQDSLKIG
ncbi:SET domain-containing protein SmydA-8 isoform X2 [Folsomia candida]|uniref:SET domain-containing protein SmydA-8 isoform X2 n=1 Tax=Folsomia candida TaxID=158441 RepID=UPI001604F202|nr:SET domain-containing protein SmydA-8 isoform X2 [Folsomia candida]